MLVNKHGAQVSFLRKVYGAWEIVDLETENILLKSWNVNHIVTKAHGMGYAVYVGRNKAKESVA